MEENKIQENWFATWFDSPYYHKLYASRDFKEAEFFIQNLIDYLALSNSEKVLDLACGKGRHSFFLSKFGLDVTGLDLAPNSILEASKSRHEFLKFDVHDMREVYKNEKFDVIFNLFTSFGYFDSEGENSKVLNSISEMLNPKGKLVIDFMNTHKVIAHLVEKEEKTCSNTTFHLERNYDGSHIFKHIRFEEKGHKYHFTERVQALLKEDFEKLFLKSGFKINATFGEFDLSTFDKENSSRLIIIAEKV